MVLCIVNVWGGVISPVLACCGIHGGLYLECRRLLIRIHVYCMYMYVCV